MRGRTSGKGQRSLLLTPDVQMTAVRYPTTGTALAETPDDRHRQSTSTGVFLAADHRRWGFEKRGRGLMISVEGGLISNHQEVLVEGALQGLGIHYAYDDRFDDLREGY